MAIGQKTGGRTKGTPNKKTAFIARSLVNVMERLEYDPYEALITESRREDVDSATRIQIHRLLLKYTYPEKSPAEDKPVGDSTNEQRFYIDIKSPLARNQE
jgi:hypothetical protein